MSANRIEQGMRAQFVLRRQMVDGGARPLGWKVAIAGRLSDAGEELRSGDRIITGVIAPPTPVEDGDVVRLELEAVGAVEVSFGALQ